MDEQNLDKNIKRAEKGAGGIFIPAGLFLGFGIGFLTDNLVAWMFIGLGVGFAAFAISLFVKK